MEVTRTSLRSQRNQVPKQISQGGQTQQKGRFGEELKQKGQEIFNIRSERPVIQAKRVDPIVSPTEQYTKDAVKTAMEKLKKFVLNQGLGGDTSGATEQTTPFASGGGGGRPNFFSGLTNDQLGRLSTQQLVDRDNRMYGNTFPDGAIGIGSKSTDDFSKNPEYQSTAGDFEKQRLAQVMSSLPSDYKQTEQKAFDDAEAYRKLVASGLDKTVSGEDAQVNVGSGSLGSFGLGTAGQGAPSGDALPAGSFGISEAGKEQALKNRSEALSKATGIPSGENLKPGSFGISTIQRTPTPTTKPTQTATTTTFGGAVDVAKSLKNIKAKQEAPKQTVASLPSNYKSTEAAAFAKAKSYKDSKAKGDAAAKATNTPSKPPAGSFGISAAGKKQAEANKAEKKKATPAQKTAIKKSTTVKKSSPSTTKSSPSSGISKSKSRGQGASKKSSSKKSGGSKSGGSKSGGSKSGGSKGGAKSSGSRGQGGGKASRTKGGSFGGKRRRSNTKRSRRRCDIRCKFDISILTNQNLIRDDLADVAYFVKDLQEIN